MHYSSNIFVSKEFLKSGARVSIFDLENSNSEALKKELNSDFEGRVFLSNVDVTDPQSVEEGLKITIQKYGKINVLVNCAGL